MKVDLRMMVGFGVAMQVLSSAAMAGPCDKILAALQQESRLTLIKQTEGKQTTEYRDGASVSLSVSCGIGKPNLAVTWDGSEPDQAYYDLVGRAGSLVASRPAADIVKASKQCRKAALKDDGEIATIEQKGLVLECQAFDRDGGGTTISVFAE